MAKKILIIEDEQTLADSLFFAFKKEGYEVATAAAGDKGLASFRSNNPDLVVLDLMLPGMPGEEVCREIRKTSEVPIIILSAKDTETDKVVALELGADDYVTKPFSLREVVVRAKGMLRRAGRPAADDREILAVAGLTMDTKAHTVNLRDLSISLTPKEFGLLELFMRNPGQVLTPSLILERVWGYDYFGSDKTVNVYIKKLREKLNDDGALIKNVRGVGYKLEVGGD
jgi:two-component system, OmpR family, response regulator RegX3